MSGESRKEKSKLCLQKSERSIAFYCRTTSFASASDRSILVSKGLKEQWRREGEADIVGVNGDGGREEEPGMTEGLDRYLLEMVAKDLNFRVVVFTETIDVFGKLL